MLKTTLEQWRMFKSVVDHGGFSQAANAVHKSQSSVHTAVQKLEQLLGVSLLQVRGRKAELTDAGHLMLRRANFLLAEAEKLEAIGQSISGGVESELHIAVDECFPQTMFLRALEHISGQYPALCMQVHETVLNGGDEMLAEGRVKLALSPRSGAAGVNEELTRVRFLPVASPRHPLVMQDRQLRLEDLKSYRQVVTRDSAQLETDDSGWLEAEQRWTVSHIKSSIDIVCRGLAFAWLPEQEVAEKLAARQLVRLPLPDSFDRYESFYLNYPDIDSLGAAARSFVTEIRLLADERV